MILICSVCGSTINENQRYAATPCGCVFHEECATPYVEQHHRCPRCEVPTQTTLPLYLSYNNANTPDNLVEARERRERIIQQVTDENAQHCERYDTEYQSCADLNVQLLQQNELTNDVNIRVSSLKKERAKSLQEMELLQNYKKDSKHLLGKVQVLKATSKELETRKKFLSEKLIKINSVNDQLGKQPSAQEEKIRVTKLREEPAKLPDNRKQKLLKNMTAVNDQLGKQPSEKKKEIEVIDLTEEPTKLPDNRNKR